MDVQAKENMRADTFIGRKKKPLKWAVFSCDLNGFANIKCEIFSYTHVYIKCQIIKCQISFFDSGCPRSGTGGLP